MPHSHYNLPTAPKGRPGIECHLPRRSYRSPGQSKDSGHPGHPGIPSQHWKCPSESHGGAASPSLPRLRDLGGAGGPAWKTGAPDWIVCEHQHRQVTPEPAGWGETPPRLGTASGPFEGSGVQKEGGRGDERADAGERWSPRPRCDPHPPRHPAPTPPLGPSDRTWRLGKGPSTLRLCR